MEIDGKVAIVTGGAVRLGKALALALAEHGTRVVVHYGSSAAPAQATVRQIQALGSDALAIKANLSQSDPLWPGGHPGQRRGDFRARQLG